MKVTFEGLPAPGSGRLVLYTMGPGFGESQAVAFPDGRWLVVDSCRQHNVCLPKRLLEHFGATQVDLLVVTHPDLDHISGLDTLISSTDVQRAWRFPKAGQLRGLVARWSKQTPRNARLVTLDRAMRALDDLATTNRLADVAYGHTTWPPPSEANGIEVRNLAPTQHDQQRGWRLFEKLVALGDGDPELSARVVRYLTRQRKNLGDHPNLASLALSVQWAGTRLLLGGDVERGDKSEHSGWRGIVGLLEEDGALAAVTDLDAIKAPHHGSDNAFEPSTWALHSRSRPVPVAVCTPFNKGGMKLPHHGALEDMRKHVSWLALTSLSGPAGDRACAAGWKPDHAEVAVSCTAACVAVVFEPDKPSRIVLGHPSQTYVST